MKTIPILIVLIFLANSCKSQPNTFSLIGEWRCVEEHGSNGGREFISKIKDGDVLIFGTGNTVITKNGSKGLYSI